MSYYHPIPGASMSQQPQTGSVKVVAGYGLHQRLGSGSFATVYKGVKVSPDTPGADTVAVKAITRTSEKLTKKVLQNLEIEIAILQKYRHRNIVCLQDVQKTEGHFYLILEYCGGGDLQQLIRTRKTGRLSECLTRRLMRDLSGGLKFLWGQAIIHRDIKPQNLLLTGALPLDELNDPERTDAMEEKRRQINYPSDQFALKIADFGFARHLQSASLAETLCGSPLYMAPEILQHHRYDAKADLWSVGTVLFEMIAGRPPFHGENHMDLLRNIQKKAVRLPPEVRVSKACVNLLRLLLNRNPLSRAGFKQFFEACDAFVALGCEGVVLEDDGSSEDADSRRPSLTGHQDLGTIPEDDGGTGQGAESICTVQTTMHPPHQQQPVAQTPPASVPFVLSPTLRARTVHKYPVLMPLEPSPPAVARVIQPPDLPVLPALDLNNSKPTSGQNQPAHVSQQQQLLANQQTQYSNVEPAPVLGGPQKQGNGSGGSSPLQSSGGDSGFVLVDYDSSHSPSATAIVSSSSAGNDQHIQQQHVTQHQFQHQFQHQHLIPPQNQVYYRGGSGGSGGGLPSRLEPSPPASPSPRYFMQTPTGNPAGDAARRGDYMVVNEGRTQRGSKGILSTSPGTGGMLMGLIGGKRILNTAFHSIPHPPNAITASNPNANNMLEAQISASSKLLAAAEDVGRRAVSVAHLGDARAYLALRLAMKSEGSSSLLSVTPMEGIEEDFAGTESSGAVSADESGSTEIMTTTRRGSISTDRTMTDVIKEEEEAEEMPFACVSPDLHSASLSAGIPSRSTPSVHAAAPASTKHVAKPTPSMVQAHFKEAMSCYLKALKMLKGAVTAAQKVDRDLGAFSPQQQCLSNEQLSRVQVVQKRCGVTAGWLSGQFTGVLERGDAANIEIGKLEAASLAVGPHPVTQLEELIYNHALSCGRDGAVKQLLGQYDAARSCYRSAGLLAESLLMESNIGIDDRKILEGYVDGFATRITELDGVMLQQSRLVGSTVGSSISGSSRRGSGIGIVGLVGQPMQRPTFNAVGAAK